VDGAVRPPAVVALRCRTSDRTQGAALGVDALAPRLAERLGVQARTIGRFAGARTARYDEDLASSRGCLLEAGGQVDDALAAGSFPVLVAAECSVALTTLPVVHRHRPDARVLWLDAHGDFNTPDTSPSGYLGGMCLAGATGRWDPGLGQAPMPVDRVVLCGVRDLDGPEREALERHRATVIGAALETLVYVVNALDDAPVYVHLDLDVLDPETMPARFPAPGGLSEEKLYDLLDAVAGASEIVGVEVTCLEDPARAGAVVDLLAPLIDGLQAPAAPAR
jgi:arginase family enzyme